MEDLINLRESIEAVKENLLKASDDCTKIIISDNYDCKDVYKLRAVIDAIHLLVNEVLVPENVEKAIQSNKQ